MGLFSSPSSQPSHTNPTPSPDGAYIAPNRSARDQCWAARDAFFSCLDKNGIVDSVGKEGKAEAERLCGREESGLRRECAASWVSGCVFVLGRGARGGGGVVGEEREGKREGEGRRGRGENEREADCCVLSRSHTSSKDV